MINNYIGGNKKIIKRGLNLILLNMLSDYARDQEIDQKAGKYNPVTAGKIDYSKERERLTAQIKSVKLPYMDEILDPENAPLEFWGS